MAVGQEVPGAADDLPQGTRGHGWLRLTVAHMLSNQACAWATNWRPERWPIGHAAGTPPSQGVATGRQRS